MKAWIHTPKPESMCGAKSALQYRLDTLAATTIDGNGRIFLSRELCRRAISGKNLHRLPGTQPLLNKGIMGERERAKLLYEGRYFIRTQLLKRFRRKHKNVVAVL